MNAHPPMCAPGATASPAALPDAPSCVHECRGPCFFSLRPHASIAWARANSLSDLAGWRSHAASVSPHTLILLPVAAALLLRCCCRRPCGPLCGRLSPRSGQRSI